MPTAFFLIPRINPEAIQINSRVIQRVLSGILAGISAIAVFP